MIYTECISARKETTASALAVDACGTVRTLLFDNKQAERMRSIGITEGTPIACMYRRSGIAAYLIRGALVGIRDEDAAKIVIENGKGDIELER